MKTRETLKTEGTRYTVFSLWDTYRNLHQLMSLVYPEQQSNMVKSMLQIYDESGWLPKWELNATETTTTSMMKKAPIIKITLVSSAYFSDK